MVENATETLIVLPGTAWVEAVLQLLQLELVHGALMPVEKD